MSGKKQRKLMAILLAIAVTLVNFQVNAIVVEAVNYPWYSLTVMGSDLAYTGHNIEPSNFISTVSLQKHMGGGQVTTVESSEYNCTVTSDSTEIKDIGKYKLMVTATGKTDPEMQSDIPTTFEVTPKTLNVTWPDSAPVTFNGTRQIPTPTITVDETSTDITEAGVNVGIGGENCIATLKINEADFIDAGTYTATVELSGDRSDQYTLNTETRSHEYTISRKTLSQDDAEITLNPSSYTYTASAKEPTINTLVVDDKTWTSADYTISYENNINIGTAKVIITPTAEGTYGKNYTGTLEKPFEIVGLELGSDIVVNPTPETGTTNGNAVENWYTGDVTITAPEGYEIQQDGSTDWGSALTISKTAADGVSYQLKNNTTGEITDVQTTTPIYIDEEAPTVTASVEKEDEWTTGKTVNLAITEENIQKVYYIIGDSTETTVIEATDEEYSLTISEGLNATGREYSFYVVDKAGTTSNASTVTINKIDKTSPTIATPGDKIVNGASTFEIGISDSGSGVDETILKKGDVIIENWEGKTIAFTPTEVGKAETVIYTITARDNVGNSMSDNFKVVYDPTAPTIDVKGIFVGDDEIGDRWLNNQDFENDQTPVLRFTVKDEHDIEEVKVDNTKITPIEDSTYEVALPKRDFNGTYVITASDIAGNESTAKPDVKVDVTAPTMEHVMVVGTDNKNEANLWYNKGDLNITLDTTDTMSGVAGVYGLIDDDADTDENRLEFSKGADDSYTSYTSYTLAITDADFAQRTYSFYGYDVAGNVVKYDTTETLSRDSQAPDSANILVSFENTEDTDSASKDTMDGSVIEKIVNFVKNIFVTEKVTLRVYVPDEVVNNVKSGVQTVTLTYGGTSYTKTPIEGESAYVDDEDTSYEIFEFELKSSEESEEIEDGITITKVTDVAGNTCGDAKFSIAGGNLIIIDDVAPVLGEVDYKTEAQIINGKEYYFYNSDLEMDFVITEKNFFAKLENNETLNATILNATTPIWEVNPSEGATSVTAPSWEPSNENSNQAKAKATFPVGENTESEYTYTLNYQDPSGNKMKTYTSKTIVMDTKAPILKKFDIVSSGNSSLVQDETNTNLYYAKNIAGADIQLQLEIEDQYFNEKAVKVEYQKVSEADATWEALSKEGVTWTSTNENENLQKATYDFDGETDSEFTYKFRVSYVDFAGNEMTTTGNTSTDGVCENQNQIVIDHKTPIIQTPTYSEPQSTNTTGDETRWYYDSTPTVGFELEDGYLQREACELTVYTRANQDSTWTQEEVLLGGSGAEYSFELPNQDAEYKFTIEYEDQAGNEASYTSPILIQDTKAPECEVTYTMGGELNTIEELKTYHGADEIVTNIKITEQNLDLEKTKVVVNTRALDGQETTTEGTLELVDDTTDEYTMEASFTEEAVYAITIEARDAVGKTATYNLEDTKTFTIDRTVPEIQVTYDNNNLTSSGYYTAKRIATITIAEANFDPDHTEIKVNGEAVLTSSWTYDSNSAVWNSKVLFNQDGTYTLTCQSMDLAENEATEYVGEAFTIKFPDVVVGNTGSNHSSDSDSILEVPFLENLLNGKLQVEKIKNFFEQEELDKDELGKEEIQTEATQKGETQTEELQEAVVEEVVQEKSTKSSKDKWKTYGMVASAATVTSGGIYLGLLKNRKIFMLLEKLLSKLGK